MLKKLKRKFIIINMALVGGVLIFMLTVICINTYKSQTDLAEDNLSNVLTGELITFDDHFIPFHVKDDDNNGHNQNKKFIPAAVVEMNPSGISVENYIDNLGISRDELLEVTTDAMNQSKSFGYLPKCGLYYMKQKTARNYRLAFIDGTPYRHIVAKTIFASSMLLTTSMFTIFLISMLLSGLAIKPVRKAWDQQQQFIANASHELKTPLTVILANNNILHAHASHSIKSQIKWINSTKNEAKHMSKLVNDLLFLTKSDGEQTHMITSEVNFNELCSASVLQFEPVAFEKKVTLSSRIEPDILLQGDATQLRQLVQILLDNACKYTPAGYNINLRLTKSANEIKLIVTNTGSFIPPADLPHIFERFYRSDKARTINAADGDQGGYGLGLSIANKIVKRHKGSIVASSTLHKGTTFTVILKK